MRLGSIIVVCLLTLLACSSDITDVTDEIFSESSSGELSSSVVDSLESSADELSSSDSSSNELSSEELLSSENPSDSSSSSVPVSSMINTESSSSEAVFDTTSSEQSSSSDPVSSAELSSSSESVQPSQDKFSYAFDEPPVTGNTFYIDPINGSPDGDGSEQNPWRTLQEVANDGLIEYYKHSENNNADSEWEVVNEGAPVKGGDKLVLKTGYHGYIRRSIWMFKDWIHIVAGDGEKPVLSNIYLVGAIQKVHFKGLSIIKSSFVPADDATGEDLNYWEAEAINRTSGTMIYIASNDFWGKASHVILQNNYLATVEDNSIWSQQDWIDKAASGIGARSATDLIVIGNTIENTAFGLAFDYNSDNTDVINNTVKYYKGDGMRVISDHMLIQGNLITDCIDVDENHDDGIQGWSRGEDNRSGGGVVTDVVIRGNTIIGTTDWNHPLRGNPQGLGFFDGMFDNFVVEYNVVATNHYHGISFYGFTNSTIDHNTVVDQIDGDDLSPWIYVVPHKNGTESENVLVRNNIVNRLIKAEGTNVSESGNYIIGMNNYSSLSEIFVDFDGFDYRLKDNQMNQTNLIGKGVEIDSENPNPTIGAFEL